MPPGFIVTSLVTVLWVVSVINKAIHFAAEVVEREMVGGEVVGSKVTNLIRFTMVTIPLFYEDNEVGMVNNLLDHIFPRHNNCLLHSCTQRFKALIWPWYIIVESSRLAVHLARCHG